MIARPGNRARRGAAERIGMIERVPGNRDGKAVKADPRERVPGTECGTRHKVDVANPCHALFVRMQRTSGFEFTWTDERGRSAGAEARVTAG